MRKKRKRVLIWISRRGLAKLAVTLLLIGVVITVFFSEQSTSNTWSHWKTPLSGKIIAIDAGHGGPDGGAESREGVMEKHINLAISNYLRDFLQQSGALVVMTREEDIDLADPEMNGLSRRKTQDLHRRADFIAEKNADLLISIHLNSIPSPRWRGAQTFYFPEGEENRKFAFFIQEELKLNLENTERMANMIKTNYLLKTAKVPSALVEVGFLSNQDEANLLQDEAYQKKVAASIYRGILRYASGETVSPDALGSN